MYKLGQTWHTCGCYGAGFIPTDATGYAEYLASRARLFAARVRSAERRADVDTATRAGEVRYWTELLAQVQERTEAPTTLSANACGTAPLDSRAGRLHHQLDQVSATTMTFQIFERFLKWSAIRSYRANLGHLLVERYGRGRRFTPAQVLATIKRYGFNERYAPYACALFCSKRAYDEFVGQQASVAPLEQSSVAHLAGITTQAWPRHHEIVSDLHHSFGGDRGGDLASDGNHSFHGLGADDVGGSGDAGGSHDGGAGGDGSH
jgi:hypothetical protein